MNVKEKSDGTYVYSYNAERQNKKPSTQRTLHAVVNNLLKEEIANAQLYDTNVPQPEESVKSKLSTKGGGLDALIKQYGEIEPGVSCIRTRLNARQFSGYVL